MALALKDSIESRVEPGKFYFSDFEPHEAPGFIDLCAPLDPYHPSHMGADFAAFRIQSVAW